MPTITERSLIKMGNGGLVITIPKAWAKFYKLQAGEKVEVTTNGDLRVRPQRRKRRR